MSGGIETMDDGGFADQCVRHIAAPAIIAGRARADDGRAAHRIAALEREKRVAMQNDEFERCAEIRDEIQTVRCCPCPLLPLPSAAAMRLLAPALVLSVGRCAWRAAAAADGDGRWRGRVVRRLRDAGLRDAGLGAGLGRHRHRVGDGSAARAAAIAGRRRRVGVRPGQRAAAGEPGPRLR